MEDDALLESLNSSPTYDHSVLLNNFLQTNDDTQTFTNVNISSLYHDINSLTTNYSNSKTPLILSLNIQSLQSKFNALVDFITQLETLSITIDVIALQETWNITYPDLFTIPGFRPLILESRNNSRGGGGRFLH